MVREQRQKGEGLRSCTLDLEVKAAWLELVRARNPAVPSDQVPSGSLATRHSRQFALRKMLSARSFPKISFRLDEF